MEESIDNIKKLLKKKNLYHMDMKIIIIKNIKQQ